MTVQERVWLRLGDHDKYHAFDSIQEAAEALKELGVRGPFRRCNVYGIEAPGFYAVNARMYEDTQLGAVHK